MMLKNWAKQLKEYKFCAYCRQTVAWRYKFSLWPEVYRDMDTRKQSFYFVGKWRRLIQGACPCFVEVIGLEKK